MLASLPASLLTHTHPSDYYANLSSSLHSNLSDATELGKRGTVTFDYYLLLAIHHLLSGTCYLLLSIYMLLAV